MAACKKTCCLFDIIGCHVGFGCCQPTSDNIDTSYVYSVIHVYMYPVYSVVGTRLKSVDALLPSESSMKFNATKIKL